jgi:hypothetical protein
VNIFQVLSQGKSRLHEPSMSAMLGYLLDSNKDHGLGDAFIRKFVEHQDNPAFQNILDAGFINSQVSLEEPYQLNGSRKDIDIQIIILDSNKDEAHRIIIENKIKIGAASPKQLDHYYRAILEEENDIQNLHMIFLTPNSKAKQLETEFANLELQIDSSHSKNWIFWADDENTKGILTIIKDILELETIGSINPINEYMRHTLKAFIKHSSTITGLTKSMRAGEDIGEVTEETIIELKDGERYRVVRRDSTQVQVFNLASNEKEIAKKIMSKFITENDIDIDTNAATNSTRTIGKRFFDWNRGKS